MKASRGSVAHINPRLIRRDLHRFFWPDCPKKSFLRLSALSDLSASFCVFLRLSVLSAVLIVLCCSGSDRHSASSTNLNKPSRTSTDQFGTVRSNLSHHIPPNLKNMVRPVPNNSIRRMARCAKLLHTNLANYVQLVHSFRANNVNIRSICP